jgi:S1-C subfamily serine protease
MKKERTFIWDICVSLFLVFAFISSSRGADIDLTDLFAKTSPSVVTLTTYTVTGTKIGQGSGFIVDKSGVIVTCFHVVADAATVEIRSSDQSTQIATAIICSNKIWDVALLQANPLPQPPLKLASPDAIRVGTSVIAIGSPLGYGNTLSQGIISGLRSEGDLADMIQITAPVSPGSSGGPILSTATGEILGMTVASLNAGQNINFAVPARVIVDQLKAIGQPPERKLMILVPTSNNRWPKQKRYAPLWNSNVRKPTQQPLIIRLKRPSQAVSVFLMPTIILLVFAFTKALPIRFFLLSLAVAPPQPRC